MKRYLLGIYQPDGETPEPEFLEPIMAEMRKLNEEMQAAGAWVQAVGLHDASTATVVRERGGEVVLTDGPFSEGKEHLGGFTIIQAEDLDAALAWAGRMATIVSPLAIEVRPVEI